mmetsp:Transcript_9722/g.19128  ORF Transcript_9722/g.19128 Transcript_9722/m.19128 type:complete len:204 (-) Transcript_9722:378-989(-)
MQNSAGFLFRRGLRGGRGILFFGAGGFLVKACVSSVVLVVPLRHKKVYKRFLLLLPINLVCLFRCAVHYGIWDSEHYRALLVFLFLARFYCPLRLRSFYFSLLQLFVVLGISRVGILKSHEDAHPASLRRARLVMNRFRLLRHNSLPSQPPCMAMAFPRVIIHNLPPEVSGVHAIHRADMLAEAVVTKGFAQDIMQRKPIALQ